MNPFHRKIQEQERSSREKLSQRIGKTQDHCEHLHENDIPKKTKNWKNKTKNRKLINKNKLITNK